MDVVGQGIQFELFESLKNDLHNHLIKDLGLESPDGMHGSRFYAWKITNEYAANERCAALLAVDPHIEERRLQLKKEQTSLLEARLWLQTLDPAMDGEIGMDTS